MSSISSSEDCTQYLIQKLADYMLLYQQCSDRIRPIGHVKMNAIYNEAYKEWKSDPRNPLTEPPVGDEAKCDDFFARCDAICVMESQTQNAHEYVPQLGFPICL
jgi:hypothetical protein